MRGGTRLQSDSLPRAIATALPADDAVETTEIRPDQGWTKLWTACSSVLRLITGVSGPRRSRLRPHNMCDWSRERREGPEGKSKRFAWLS